MKLRIFSLWVLAALLLAVAPHTAAAQAVTPTPSATLAQTPTPTITPAPVWGVNTTTPDPDGSIWHIIQEGQNLDSIARAYGLTLAQLLAMNNLEVGTRIFPNQALLIRPAFTLTPTSAIPDTPTPFTPEATSTRRPTRTPLPPTATRPPATPTQTPTPDPLGWARTEGVGSLLMGGVILSGLAGVLLIVAGILLKRRAQLPED